MSRLFASFTRQPLAWIGGLFVFLWVVYVGAALRPRLALPPMDTSRPILASRGSSTSLLQNTADGQIRTVEKIIGPVAPWKNGLVYWDDTKSGLFYAPQGGQKARAVWLRPSFLQLGVESITPAPGGVYLNLDGNVNKQTKFKALYVHLPDGAAKVVPHVEEIKSGETTTTYACRMLQKASAVVVVHYADGKTRTVPISSTPYVSSWDYDPVRDAVVWIEDGAVCYNSPRRSWHKNISVPYTVGYGSATGDVWVQTYGGGFGSRGMLVLSEDGVERGWRWRGETIYSNQMWELSPEQEKLARALPSHK